MTRQQSQEAMTGETVHRVSTSKAAREEGPELTTFHNDQQLKENSKQCRNIERISRRRLALFCMQQDSEQEHHLLKTHRRSNPIICIPRQMTSQSYCHMLMIWVYSNKRLLLVKDRFTRRVYTRQLQQLVIHA